MEYLIVCAVAFFASSLTLFSGFGLGTLLMPVIAIFFPLEVAVAVTGLVHLANNGFKLLLLGRSVDLSVLLRFGLPAVLGASFGAAVLVTLSTIDLGFEYSLFGRVFTTTVVNIVVGSLILVFVMVELLPLISRPGFAPGYLPLGGVLSGFFGGLSGHQGAFRSMFLLKMNLSKEAFIATGVSIAVLVDITRLTIYGSDLFSDHEAVDWGLVIAASIAAFLAAFLGARLLHKVTLRSVQSLVSFMLVLIAIALTLGFI